MSRDDIQAVSLCILSDRHLQGIRLTGLVNNPNNHFSSKYDFGNVIITLLLAKKRSEYILTRRNE